jgi:Mg-chelatase subunit ChlD
VRDIYLPIAIEDEPCNPQAQHADVALVIDASTSMLDETRAGRTKLAAAQEAARVFLDLLDLNADQAAVISFNREAHLLQFLTGDRPALDAAIGTITALQQTRLDLAIEAAHAELTSPRHRPDNARVMIVVTDGQANPVPVEVAVQRALAAKAAGIRIFTIGLGDTVEADALRQIASAASDYFAAPDAEDLACIYRQVAFDIPCPASRFWAGR